MQCGTLFCEGQCRQHVFLAPARGSSPAAGDASAFPPAWGQSATSKEMRDRNKDLPSAAPESTQQHCTPCSIHGAVKLKVTRAGFTHASIIAAPCTETPTGESLHTRAPTSPVMLRLQPPSCCRCSVVGFPHTRHSACKKVLEFPNTVLSKVSKIRG